MDESASRDRRARALAREIATHRRAIEVHETAVAKFTEVGQAERAQAARMRLQHARKMLQEALDQGREFLQQGYAAMGMSSGPNYIAHAVADGYPASVCGLEAAGMVGIAEDFIAVPAERQCSACAAAIENAG